MAELTDADMIWNWACGEGPLRSLPGDRALADLLRANGLAMNGGVLHAIGCLTATELAEQHTVSMDLIGLHPCCLVRERFSRRATILEATSSSWTGSMLP